MIANVLSDDQIERIPEVTEGTSEPSNDMGEMEVADA